MSERSAETTDQPFTPTGRELARVDMEAAALRIEVAELRRRLAVARGALFDCVRELKVFRLFVTTQEMSHELGVEIYDKTTKKAERALAAIDAPMKGAGA